jgi:hypothetical protein
VIKVSGVWPKGLVCLELLRRGGEEQREEKTIDPLSDRERLAKLRREQRVEGDFVKFARTYKAVPIEPHVSYGLLHDCSSTHATDECHEPKPDEDEWEQFCFKYNRTLRKKRIFIEFIMNRDEWFDDPEAKKNWNAHGMVFSNNFWFTETCTFGSPDQWTAERDTRDGRSLRTQNQRVLALLLFEK